MSSRLNGGEVRSVCMGFTRGAPGGGPSSPEASAAPGSVPRVAWSLPEACPGGELRPGLQAEGASGRSRARGAGGSPRTDARDPFLWQAQAQAPLMLWQNPYSPGAGQTGLVHQHWLPSVVRGGAPPTNKLPAYPQQQMQMQMQMQMQQQATMEQILTHGESSVQTLCRSLGPCVDSASPGASRGLSKLFFMKVHRQTQQGPSCTPRARCAQPDAPASGRAPGRAMARVPRRRSRTHPVPAHADSRTEQTHCQRHGEERVKRLGGAARGREAWPSTLERAHRPRGRVCSWAAGRAHVRALAGGMFERGGKRTAISRTRQQHVEDLVLSRTRPGSVGSKSAPTADR